MKLMERRSEMKFTIIESPYAASDRTGVTVAAIEHLNYLHRCIRHSVDNNECPYASHLMLTGALDDNNTAERQQGLKSGFHARTLAQQTVVYIDYGISEGMLAGIEDASRLSTLRPHPIIYRTIGKN